MTKTPHSQIINACIDINIQKRRRKIKEERWERKKKRRTTQKTSRVSKFHSREKVTFGSERLYMNHVFAMY